MTDLRAFSQFSVSRCAFRYWKNASSRFETIRLPGSPNLLFASATFSYSCNSFRLLSWPREGPNDPFAKASIESFGFCCTSFNCASESCVSVCENWIRVRWTKSISKLNRVDVGSWFLSRLVTNFATDLRKCLRTLSPCEILLSKKDPARNSWRISSFLDYIVSQGSIILSRL